MLKNILHVKNKKLNNIIRDSLFQRFFFQIATFFVMWKMSEVYVFFLISSNDSGSRPNNWLLTVTVSSSGFCRAIIAASLAYFDFVSKDFWNNLVKFATSRILASLLPKWNPDSIWYEVKKILLDPKVLKHKFFNKTIY